MRKQITLSEIAAAAMNRLRASMYHCVPGIVHAYDSTHQTANVQPAVNDVRTDPDTGETFSEAFPILPAVPVAFPGGGGMRIAWPLQAGDRVLLVAFDLDPTKHRLTGNTEDPDTVGRHTGSYWWAYPADVTDPGLMHDASAASSALVLGRDGQNQQVRIGSTYIQLGAAASDFVGLASKIDAAVANIVSAFNMHIHPTPSGPSGAPTVPIPAQSSTASSLVKTG